MKTVMVMLAFGTLGAATIGLLLSEIGFLSGWGWAYRAALACGALFLLFAIWGALLSEIV